MVVIHSSDESPVISECSFNLGRVLELEFLVDITRVLHRPPFADAFVDRSPIGPQSASGFDLSEEEIPCMVSLYVCAHDDIVCQITRAFLLAHDQCHTFEICLVQLHYTL